MDNQSGLLFFFFLTWTGVSTTFKTGVVYICIEAASSHSGNNMGSGSSSTNGTSADRYEQNQTNGEGCHGSLNSVSLEKNMNLRFINMRGNVLRSISTK